MAKASDLGRLLHEPFGESGLKIAESREVIELMNSTSVGDQAGVVVLGPMDRAQRSAQDVLLKSIEEFDGEGTRPVLWAFDETEVLPTIRSRCLRQWCPGAIVQDETVVETARSTVTLALHRDVPGLIEILKDADPREVLEAVAQVLAEREFDEDTRDLWEQIREVLRFKNPTDTEVLTAFLLEAAG